MKRSHVAILLFTTLGYTSCGKNQDSEAASDEWPTVAESVPEDTSGAMGKVDVNFGNNGSYALALVEDEAEPKTLTISDAIKVDEALFSIAKIKLKANVDVADDEEELAKKENESEKTAADEVDDEGDDDAALKEGRQDETAKQRHENRRKDLEERKGDLEKKEHARIKDEAEHDKSTKFVGPYIYDAVNGALEGEIPAIETADGSYRRVEFQLKRSYDERLLGDVFRIHGTVTKDGAEVPFLITWHMALNFRMTGDDAFKVAASEDNELQINFDLVKWFEGIDLASATVAEDGTIYIDKSSNRELLHAMHANMKKSVRCGKDKNDDGQLSDDEKSGEGVDTVDASNE